MKEPFLINTQTKLCAVIGNPVSHSLSPLIHNAAFRHLDLNYVYMAFKVEDIAGAITGLRSLDNMIGLSVTIPHKINIIKELDEIDPIADNIGSVNTVAYEQKRLKGFCTDGLGALKALQDSDILLEDKTIIIIGSGGAARAISFTLAMKSKLKSMLILGIDEQEINLLVSDIKAKTPFNNLRGVLISDTIISEEIKNADILINCSPIGMYPHCDNSPINTDFLHKALAVMDIVYNPLKTKLLQEAEKIGCQIIPGQEMFINQAALQFELWTKQPAPVQIMKDVFTNHWNKPNK